MKRWFVLATAAVMAASLLLPATGAAAPERVAARRPLDLQAERAGGQRFVGPRGPLTAVQRAAMQGALRGDAGAPAVQPDQARRAAARPAPSAPARPQAPVIDRSWQGIFDNGGTPPDTTSAVGTNRFMELVNREYAIYNRTSNSPLSNGSLSELADVNPLDNVFDPQVIWDPGTKRFYYVMDQIVSANDNRLAFGWSRNASPNSALDFCHYTLTGYGDLFPDYPKLGDTKNFILFGVNTFSPTAYIGSDVISITKPPSGTTCADPATFIIDVFLDLKNADGTFAFTPVPANQTDTGGTGWVVSYDSYFMEGADLDHLNLHKVTRLADGHASMGATQTVPVSSFALPASAPQSGTTVRLDTLDARPTQAVSAIDPNRGSNGKLAIWTQHAVNGAGGRSIVRWYEINPATNGLFQNGTVSHNTLFVFNGAISPDRVRKGSTKAFGGSMVLGFSTSSSGTFPAIQMVSKIGNGAQSGFVLVRQSPGFNRDFSCGSGGSPPCRWGDYAGATPDPNADPTGNTGVVWLSNQWNVASASNSDVDWRTQNWIARP